MFLFRRRLLFIFLLYYNTKHNTIIVRVSSLGCVAYKREVKCVCILILSCSAKRRNTRYTSTTGVYGEVGCLVPGSLVSLCLFLFWKKKISNWLTDWEKKASDCDYHICTLCWTFALAHSWKNYEKRSWATLLTCFFVFPLKHWKKYIMKLLSSSFNYDMHILVISKIF